MSYVLKKKAREFQICILLNCVFGGIDRIDPDGFLLALFFHYIIKNSCAVDDEI